MVTNKCPSGKKKFHSAPIDKYPRDFEIKELVYITYIKVKTKMRAEKL